jgi:hypothetical protein
MQILEEAPEVYAAMDRLIEATDWIVEQLTGQERRSSCAAGYKALWSKRDGYPARGFFASLDGRLADAVASKLSLQVYPVGSRAGSITAAGVRADRTAAGHTGRRRPCRTPCDLSRGGLEPSRTAPDDPGHIDLPFAARRRREAVRAFAVPLKTASCPLLGLRGRPAVCR